MTELAQSTDRRTRPIAIDDDNVVTADRIFVHRSAKGFVCVGLGAGAELIKRAERIGGPLQATQPGWAASRFGDPFLDRLLPLAKGYNPDEARVPAGSAGGGQWTAGGMVANAVSATASLFETDSPLVAAGLATIASRLSAPTALLGTLFIPTNRSLISSGTLPKNPDVSYRYDRDTGTLTLTDSDGFVLFSGHHGAGGTFRDSNGTAIGRMVDGALVLDPDTLAGYASRSQPSAQSRAGAQSQTQSVTARDEPKLCPDPSKDRPGSSRGAVYQAYIAGVINPDLPTPPGMAVALFNPVKERYVYFDDCRHIDGVMIEAKGPGYEKLIKSSSKYPRFKGFIDKRFTDQANRQFDAAQGRPIEWYFAEKGAADYVRELFKGDPRLSTIKIIYMPRPQ